MKKINKDSAEDFFLFLKRRFKNDNNIWQYVEELWQEFGKKNHIKPIYIKLYCFKSLFNDNWNINVSTFRNWHYPDSKFWSKFPVMVTMKTQRAEKVFGHYLNAKSFEVSNEFFRNNL